MNPNPTTHDAPPAEGLKLHMGIAEQGKIYAVEGNHKLALAYYQSAINMTVQAGDPELFFRLYLESALESMEHLGLHDEVIDYCNRALKIYEENPPSEDNDFAKLDFANIHQRKGIVLFKMGQKEEAKEYLKKALDLIKKEKGKFPLSEKVLRWAQTGMYIDAKRVLSEQKSSKYFTVTKENLRPEAAIKLPDEQNMVMTR